MDQGILKIQRVQSGRKRRDVEETRGDIQGTTGHAAILFLIMTGDMIKDIINRVVSCFVNDTRNSKEIRAEEDKKTIQEDLSKIYEWAEKNVMKFNEGKV